MSRSGDAPSIWYGEEWFDQLPSELVRNPNMDDEQFELMIGRETGIAEGAGVEVPDMREYLENARRRLQEWAKLGASSDS